MDYRLTLHRETLGVTHQALKALRDELAKRIDHELLVFQVSSPDGAHCEVYGFFLVDKTAAEVIIIGDGFRGDNGGEGGSGHRACQALLAIYGLTPIQMMPEDAIDYRDDASPYPHYRQAVNKALEIAEGYHFDVAWLKIPKYVDWCFDRKR